MLEFGNVDLRVRVGLEPVARHERHVHQDDDHDKHLEARGGDEVVKVVPPELRGLRGGLERPLREQLFLRKHPIGLVLSHVQQAVVLRLDIRKGVDNNTDR